MTPRPADRDLVHLGARNTVLALDLATGEEVWRVKLKSGSFTHVVRVGERVLAANQGEVWCLDARTGNELWHNPLKGLGLGLVSLAGPAGEAASGEQGTFVTVAEQLRREQSRRQAST